MFDDLIWDEINISKDSENRRLVVYIGNPENYGGFGSFEECLDSPMKDAVEESYDEIDLPVEFYEPEEIRPEDLQAYHIASIDNSTDLDEDIDIYVNELVSSIRTKFNEKFGF